MKLLPWSPSSSLVHALVLWLSLAAATPALRRCSAAVAVSDGQTLLSIKAMISDPLGNLNSWNNSQHYCNWDGVTCAGRRHPDRVRRLILSSGGLSGEIPPQIANLSFLRKLHLGDNAFGGGIPPELGKLSRLRYLNLSMNNLTGDIPVALTQCSRLRLLELSENNLTGVIPKNIDLLKELQNLKLRQNSLTGSIPASVGNITGLEVLHLSHNQLEGGIPETIGKLSSLEVLYLSFNRLTGSLPASLFNASSLETLAIANNSLEGNLPADMFVSLPNLAYAIFYNTHLQGMIPPSLANASNIAYFDVGNGFFTGTVPSNLGNLPSLYYFNLANNQIEASEDSGWEFLTSLTNCTNLQHLDLHQNMLGGSLPASVSNLSSNLQTFFFGLNHIHGIIPSGIANLLGLTALDLSFNQLSGVIPDAIAGLASLKILELKRNNLSGRIPYSIGNLTSLYALILRRNNITGRMPESIGNCKSLQMLDVSDNKITGAIPRTLLSLSSLSRALVLSKNLFNGPLPMEVGNLIGLNIFDVSYNKLSGQIPSAFASCLSLELLHLQNNIFNGTIPPALSRLKGLQELDVSHNNLSGRIPETLGLLDGLQNLNLSFNDLEGEVPGDGIFRNISVIELGGNANLCGGNPGFHLPSCYMRIERRQHRSFFIKLFVPILTGIVLLIITSIIYCKMKKPKKTSFSLSPIGDEYIRVSLSPIGDEYIKVSYRELVRATDGFSASNLIGKGSFGSVYKGNLRGSIVAVKVVDLQTHGASKSFMAECEVLRSTRHHNLVQIITVCSSIDSIGHEFKALVLKYMPNGSLEDWLHQTEPEISAAKCLSLIQRLNIAMDVAHALDYLHGRGSVPIVHCDVKPSNVLLDEDMSAHVSDFGIARFLQEKSSTMSGNYSESLAIRGTVGYVAPEYGMGGEISTNGDVYSYGILLLEMFTGRKATDDMFRDGENLHNYVKMTPPTHVHSIVDQRMLLLIEDDDNEGQLNAEDLRRRMDMVAVQESAIVSVLDIGLSCSKEDPRDRMTMSQVIKQLHDVRNMVPRPPRSRFRRN